MKRALGIGAVVVVGVLVIADPEAMLRFITGLIGLAVVVGLYFLPTIVAQTRHVPNVGSIAIINTFLGWTLVGWVVSLAMAARSVPPTMDTA